MIISTGLLYKTSFEIFVSPETKVLLYFANKLSEVKGIIIFGEFDSYFSGTIKFQLAI